MLAFALVVCSTSSRSSSIWIEPASIHPSRLAYCSEMERLLIWNRADRIDRLEEYYRNSNHNKEQKRMKRAGRREEEEKWWTRRVKINFINGIVCKRFFAWWWWWWSVYPSIYLSVYSLLFATSFILILVFLLKRRIPNHSYSKQKSSVISSSKK